MPTVVESSEVLAVEASCSDHELTVILDDGRTVSVPLVWFPRLLTASPKQRKDWGTNRRRNRPSLGSNRRRHLGSQPFATREVHADG